MSSYAGQNLFGSGPHAFRFGPWQRSVQRRGFAGLNGELVLDLGLRSRQIFQTGRLQADSASGLNGLLDAINARGDGAEHALVDNHGQSHPHVMLERFEPTSPLQRGRQFYCDYKVDYRELP